jgi:probable addiction module antidote protein
MKVAKIETEDFFEGFANDIKNNPKKLKEFEKVVNSVYEETGDVDVILGALKVLAHLKGNITKLARKSDVERASVYNLFKNGSNPTFRNFISVSQNLGVELKLSFSYNKV